MVELTFAFGSFLRLCQLDTDQQIRSIERKLAASSGYDFYHSLNRAIKAQIKGESRDMIDDILLSPSNAVEREYNLSAFNSFMSRYGSKNSLEAIDRPRAFALQGTGLSVRCDPLFSTTEKDVTLVHAVWATRTPPLQKKYAAVGCYLLKECYRKSSLSNSVFAVANLVDGTRTGEKSIGNTTAAVLRADAGKLWQMVLDHS